MKDGRSREQFAKDQNKVVKLVRVTVHEFGIDSVEIETDKAAIKAQTHASDDFNPDGIIEYEIDHLLRIDGFVFLLIESFYIRVGY